MPSKTLYYRYNKKQPLSVAEQEVIALGYPYVSTTELGPGGRLNEHRHHSKNTRIILKGSIIIGKSRDETMRFRPNPAFPYSLVNLPSGVDYMGVAGENGCVFVEGHMVLSPTTAKRFEDRGTIEEARKGMKGAFPAEEH